MGLIDGFIVATAVKKLTKPFNQWNAYKLGIIDGKGNQIREVMNKKEAKAWTALDQFCARYKQLVIMHKNESQATAILSASFLLDD